MRRCLLGFLLLSGCDSRLPPVARTPERDSLAVRTAWSALAGTTFGDPPLVFFHDEAECSQCDDEFCDGLLIAKDCRPGYCLTSPVTRESEVHVLYRRRYRYTPLAHELLHALTAVDGTAPELLGDGGHTLPRWRDDTVPDANDALDALGL